jgi:hypothetical protein
MLPQQGLPSAWPEQTDAMRVSRQTVNSIETGRYLPSLPLATALAGVAYLVLQ